MEKDPLDLESFLLSYEFEPEPSYEDIRDSFLRSKFPDYPNMKVHSFDLSFSISNMAKNGPIVYDILEVIPKEFYTVNKNNIEITISSEEELLNQISAIRDMIMIVKSWTSTRLRVNGTEIRVITEIGYLINFLFEKNNRKDTYYTRSVKEINQKYKQHKKTVNTKNTEPQTVTPMTYVKTTTPKTLISRHNVVESLNNIIDKYSELYGRNKEIEYYDVSPHDRVVVIENSLVVDFRLLPCYWSELNDKDCILWEFPYIFIQELTHNDLFDFSFNSFRRELHLDHMGVEFFSYHGVHYFNKYIDNFDTVNTKLPELQLIERQKAYPGITHHFIILRMEKPDGSFAYGVGETKGKIHSFVLKLCKELEEKNSRSLELNGASCLPFKENREFIDAFLSWKGHKKRWRLETKFSYYYEDKQIKNVIDLFSIPSEITKAANDGNYDECEFGSYNKPVNKWKSEELVYNITKQLYRDYQVIYQYKPYFLNTDKGYMSYDVYICGLKIAIEYQGKQHFEPVDYFGGKEHFEKQKERDALKAVRSKENGIKLIYVNYWEDITPDIIKKKIQDAMAS